VSNEQAKTAVPALGPVPGPVPRPVPGRYRTGGLLALASAAFVYVTAETLPIGLLPQLASGLHVHEWAVGLLVTAYAVVAGLAALPVTALLEHRPRRQTISPKCCIAMRPCWRPSLPISKSTGFATGRRF